MTGHAHVWPQGSQSIGDIQEISAVVEWPWRVSRPWRRGLRQRIWFRIPADVPVSDVAIGDACLLGTVFGAMETARRLTIHGVVTEDLLANVAQLGPLWRTRRPDRYRDVELAADAVAPGVAGDGPSILAFSGGLDSAYTLYQHTRAGRPTGGPVIGSALMVLGADIPVEEKDAFAHAVDRARRLTDDRGVPLRIASTNLRHIHQNWSHSVTAALGALMGLFRARASRGLLAIGFTRPEAALWWPQDDSDPPLVSSHAFPIVGDGYEADRFEKFDAIRNWPVAMDNLRVCYRQGSWSENCGECFKCWILGLFGRIASDRALPCLPRPVTDDDVGKICRASDRNRNLRLEQALRHARMRGLSQPWMDVVAQALGLDRSQPPVDSTIGTRSNVVRDEA